MEYILYLIFILYVIVYILGYLLCIRCHVLDIKHCLWPVLIVMYYLFFITVYIFLCHIVRIILYMYIISRVYIMHHIDHISSSSHLMTIYYNNHYIMWKIYIMWITYYMSYVTVCQWFYINILCNAYIDIYRYIHILYHVVYFICITCIHNSILILDS